MAFITTLKDDVLDTSVNESRKYTMITNSDGTVSFIDVTSYSTNGSSFTMGSINVQNSAINDMDDDSTSLAEIVDEYISTIADKLTELGVSTLVTDTVDTFVSNIETVSDTYYANGVSAVQVGTAVASNVLSGYTFTNSSGTGLSGTMTDRGAVSVTISGGNTYTIPSGYHNGSGTVTNSPSVTYTDISLSVVDAGVDEGYGQFSYNLYGTAGMVANIVGVGIVYNSTAIVSDSEFYASWMYNSTNGRYELEVFGETVATSGTVTLRIYYTTS